MSKDKSRIAVGAYMETLGDNWDEYSQNPKTKKVITYDEATDFIIALLPDTEELEKQVRQLKESDFAEIPYASDFRKVQLDGGQFVYEKVLRLIRKMEGEK